MRRVDHAGLVERSGRAGLDAERARAAVELERRRRLDLDLGDERPEHDPGAVRARDQHRVLAVETDAGPRRALAVDVLVRVDEHAVGAAQPLAERVELLAQLGVVVGPRVAGQPSLARRRLGAGRVVAERGRDDRARAGEQRLRVAGDLRLRHCEAHVGEQPAGAALSDRPLRLGVRPRGRGADDVDSELLPQLGELRARHLARKVAPLTRYDRAVKAMRIHEDGGPEVLRLRGRARSRTRTGRGAHPPRGSLAQPPRHLAAARAALGPKPRILGADGAGVVVGLGEGVDRFAEGDAVVINPGLDEGARIVGEHMDGTHAELIALPADYVYPLPDGLSFEEAASFPLVFETAYRMLVTRAGLGEGEWVFVWGIGSGVGDCLAPGRARRSARG